MLLEQTTDGKIVENGLAALTTSYVAGNCSTIAYPYAQTIWQNYPVYVCTDRTAKAIAILKELQAEKLITVNSVPKFISLVEKIAAKL